MSGSRMSQPCPSFPCFFEKAGKTTKKQGFFIPTEPLKSLEKKEKKQGKEGQGGISRPKTLCLGSFSGPDSKHQQKQLWHEQLQLKKSGGATPEVEKPPRASRRKIAP